MSTLQSAKMKKLGDKLEELEVAKAEVEKAEEEAKKSKKIKK